MYAGDNLDDALDATSRYFDAIGFFGWLKLGLVVLFISGLGILENPFDAFFEPLSVGDTVSPLAVFGITGVVLVIYLAFRYLAAVLEFVFVESLRSEAIHVRRYGRENLRHALWLLLFRILLLLVALLVVAVFVIAAGPDLGAISDGQFFAHLLATLAFALPVAIGWWVVNLLTTAFVVPIMLLNDCGPIAGWRRFGQTIWTNLEGYLGFVGVAWLIGFVLWFVFAVIDFVVTLFGGLAFAVFTMALMEANPVLGTVAFGLLVVAFLVYQYVMALLAAPVRSYVRYYALLILGDTDADLDLIPEQRAEIRSDGGSSERSERDSSVGEPEPMWTSSAESRDAQNRDGDDIWTDDRSWPDDRNETDGWPDDRNE